MYNFRNESDKTQFIEDLKQIWQTLPWKRSPIGIELSSMPSSAREVLDILNNTQPSVDRKIWAIDYTVLKADKTESFQTVANNFIYRAIACVLTAAANSKPIPKLHANQWVAAYQAAELDNPVGGLLRKITWDKAFGFEFFNDPQIHNSDSRRLYGKINDYMDKSDAMESKNALAVSLLMCTNNSGPIWPECNRENAKKLLDMGFDPHYLELYFTHEYARDFKLQVGQDLSRETSDFIKRTLISAGARFDAPASALSMARHMGLGGADPIAPQRDSSAPQAPESDLDDPTGPRV